MRSSFCISILTTSLLAGHVAAQPLDVRAPITGFVYHTGSRSLRPIFGVPGSTVLGSPVLSSVESASIAPDGRWALVTTDGRVRLIRGLSDLAPVDSPTDRELIAAVDRVVWNRAGSFALLYSSSSRQLQRVRFLRTEAIADPPIPISWGEVASLAIDAGGRQIAISMAESGLYLWNASESAPTLVSGIERPGAIVFDESGCLYVLDTAAERILRIDSASGAAEFTSLAENEGPALDPVGLAVSKSGRYLLLADRSTRAVRVYETASGNLAWTIPLEFPPSRLERLSSEPAFLLNEPRSKEWLLILNAADSPNVSFVPAGQEQAQ
jgi:hypothetical protein